MPPPEPVLKRSSSINSTNRLCKSLAAWIASGLRWQPIFRNGTAALLILNFATRQSTRD